MLDYRAPDGRVDTMQRYLSEAVTNCRRLRDGQQLAHVVNQPTGC